MPKKKRYYHQSGSQEPYDEDATFYRDMDDAEASDGLANQNPLKPGDVPGVG